MVKALVAAAVLWPAALGAAAWQSASGTSAGGHLAAGGVYYAASLVCHQLPERSFFYRDVKLPVCGRCAGLYLSGAFGALLALTRLARRRSDVRIWLALAAVPTMATLALEWFALMPVNNVARFLSALPAGAAIAIVIVRTAAGPTQSIGYTGGS